MLCRGRLTSRGVLHTGKGIIGFHLAVLSGGAEFQTDELRALHFHSQGKSSGGICSIHDCYPHASWLFSPWVRTSQRRLAWSRAMWSQWWSPCLRSPLLSWRRPGASSWVACWTWSWRTSRLQRHAKGRTHSRANRASSRLSQRLRQLGSCHWRSSKTPCESAWRRERLGMITGWWWELKQGCRGIRGHYHACVCHCRGGRDSPGKAKVRVRPAEHTGNTKVITCTKLFFCGIHLWKWNVIHYIYTKDFQAN